MKAERKENRKVKKIALGLALMLILALALGACGGGKEAPSSAQPAEGAVAEQSAAAPEQKAAEFDTSKDIGVVSREDGSGTRGAFVELFEVQAEVDGKKQDATTEEAVIANATDVMMANIAGNAYGIGYISLGSLNSTVKALDIEGAPATPENVKNGSYKVSRPFNIVTKDAPTGLAKDFIEFILSKEGQEIVASNHYIAVIDAAAAYAGSKPSGTLVIAGSSSVTPVMEKLQEAYLVMNPNAKVEIQMSDSGAGITATIDGTCDIGMASRGLKDAEAEKLQPAVQIALDGIAVVVNTENPLTDMTKEQVRAIYLGEALKWNEIIK